MLTGDYVITFVRHGETASNLQGAFLGVTDEPLNALGLQQAHATGQFLKAQQIPFDLVLTSPLLRCLQTGNILRQYIDIAPISEPLLRERHYGVFEGKTRAEIQVSLPEILNIYQKDKPFVQLPGGESAIDVEQRVKQLFWVQIPQIAPEGASILVITHLNPLRAFLRLSGLRDWDVYFQAFHNASVTQIRTDFATFDTIIDNYSCFDDPAC